MLNSYYVVLLYSENKILSIFLKWGIAMLNSVWIPNASNPCNYLKQKQKAGIQFVSITYDLKEYTYYWMSCKRQSDAEQEKSLEMLNCHPRQFSLKVSKTIPELSLSFPNGHNM